MTGSILSGCVLLGMGSNPAAVRVFRNRPSKDLRQWFRNYVRGFRNQPRTEGAGQKNCFLWVPKVTGSILSGRVLLGMGSNPAEGPFYFFTGFRSSKGSGKHFVGLRFAWHGLAATGVFPRPFAEMMSERRGIWMMSERQAFSQGYLPR